MRGRRAVGRAVAAAVALAATTAAELCRATPGYALSQPAAPSRRAALVVRGDAFRDCGHGRRCDALTALPTFAAARSHVRHVVRPLMRAGFAVDVYIATYECLEEDATRAVRTYIKKKQLYRMYGLDAVYDALPLARASEETQGDTLRRALRLVRGPVDYLVILRPDVLLIADIVAPTMASDALVFFHSDQAGGAVHPVVRTSPRDPVADKLHVLRGGGVACFVDAVTRDNCFNHTADVEDDDDGSYESGEGCYAPLASRVLGAVAFLRDLIPGTRVGTFADNRDGDSVYLVVPRALATMTPAQRAAALGVKADELGPYKEGGCDAKSRRWSRRVGFRGGGNGTSSRDDDGASSTGRDELRRR